MASLFSRLLKGHYIFFVFLLMITSCRKKIIEVVPVISIEDISISGAKDIKYFSFIGSVGYAASDTNFIYKTTDGGKSWIPVSWGVTNTYSYRCAGIEFFDELHGMCLMGRSLYVTSDGGQNWLFITGADFIGISKAGEGIAGDVGYSSCTIYTSGDKGQSFNSFNSFNFNTNTTFTNGRVTENKAFVFNGDVTYYNVLPGMDLQTGMNANITFGAFSNLTYDEDPKDVYCYNGQSFIVGKQGLLAENGRKSFSGHTYTFNSVDGFNDRVVAVGENTIVSNLDINSDEKWNDVFDTKGNGFNHTFNRVRFRDAHTFYVSGDKGLIWRATL